ncbi:MAG TPA: nucleotide exchange factor GrpE, partial [Methylomirabilota bacterium]|nr:nucleotide exchange factor GrpE [Methylomirabilota bacterium]
MADGEENFRKKDAGDRAAELDASKEARAVAEDGERAEADVARLATDLAELQRTLVRRQADFENYRKRVEKERGEDSQRTMARVIEGLIPVLDGFEHALAAHREPAYASYRQGFELIYKQMLDNLGKLGLQRQDPAGERFDPHVHQAVERVETDKHAEGTILEVFQPGYVFHGRVLRPALVRVAVHKEGFAKHGVN